MWARSLQQGTESKQGPLRRPHNSGAEPGVGLGFLASLADQNSIFDQVITSMWYFYVLMLLFVFGVKHFYLSISFSCSSCPNLHIRICPCTTIIQDLL